jgi:hypothetical protein
MSNTLDISNWFYDLLEWTYDVKLSLGQKAYIEIHNVLGMNNADQSEIDLYNALYRLYTEMASKPDKETAHVAFKKLFLLPGSLDANRILAIIHATVEAIRPGITGVEPNPEASNAVNEAPNSTAVTTSAPESTETQTNFTPDSSFPSGLYRGFKFSSYQGPIFSESGKYASYFTFYPDGRVLYGHPQTDAANIWGRYQVQGNVVYIQWNKEGNVSSPIDADGSVVFYGCRYSFFQQQIPV